MTSKNCLKVISKAEGLILFTTNFYGTDVTYLRYKQANNLVSEVTYI